MLWTTFWKQVPAPTAFTQGLNSSLVFSAIPLPIPFKFATWRQRQHFPRDNLGAAEWLKLSSLISIQQCSIKNALMQWSVNELGNTLPSLTQLMLPFSWTRPWELSRPPVCRSSAWGLHFTLMPAFPQKGLLPLTSSLWHCWHCDFFCVWFEFYSFMHAICVFSQHCVELLPSARQPSPSSHLTSLFVLTVGWNHLLLVFFPPGTSCLNLEALLPFFVQRRRDIPWRPALCTHLPLGPFPEVPSLGLPLTWRNPISTVTGNVLPWVPLSSRSHWWSCWRIS